MVKLAANISLLFTELPLRERFAAAAGHGFMGVEILRPYDEPADALAADLAAASVECVLLNTPFGTREGDTGLAALPGREDDFRTIAAQAIDYAKALRCARIHVMAGMPDATMSAEDCRAVFIDNLRWMAGEAGPDITLQIEPLNTQDFPGYFLTRQEQAHEIVAAVGKPNLGVQMDLYHCQMMEGGLSDKLRRYLGHGVTHIQIANVPGRVEPDNGEIVYPYLLSLIDELGYTGWVGAEYKPAGDTVAGLGWAAPYGISQ